MIAVTHYLDRGLRAQALLNTWMNLDAPLTDGSRDEWIARFRSVGYTRDGWPASRPLDPMVLCRGSIAADRQGLSWSPDVDVAQWFARARGGEVWLCVVPPERMLAWIGEEYGDQQVRGSEVIADVAGLPIEAL